MKTNGLAGNCWRQARLEKNSRTTLGKSSRVGVRAPPKIAIKSRRRKNRRKSFPMKIKRPRRFIHIQPRIVIVCGNSRITRREKNYGKLGWSRRKSSSADVAIQRFPLSSLKFAKAAIPDFNFSLAENFHTEQQRRKRRRRNDEEKLLLALMWSAAMFRRWFTGSRLRWETILIVQG